MCSDTRVFAGSARVDKKRIITAVHPLCLQLHFADIAFANFAELAPLACLQ